MGKHCIDVFSVKLEPIKPVSFMFVSKCKSFHICCTLSQHKEGLDSLSKLLSDPASSSLTFGFILLFTISDFNDNDVTALSLKVQYVRFFVGK